MRSHGGSRSLQRPGGEEALFCRWAMWGKQRASVAMVASFLQRTGEKHPWIGTLVR